MLLGMQFLLVDKVLPYDQKEFSEKVNLVLREVGHQLLIIAGNKTKQIPPIQHKNESTFLLKLESKLYYDTLPYLLNNSLTSYNIDKPYRVMVKDCMQANIILGYTTLAFENKNVPCLGRDAGFSCNVIEVVFEEDDKSGIFPFRLISGGLGFLGMVSFIWLYFFKKDPVITSENEEEVMVIGNLKFDPQNLIIGSSSKSKKLTYRENKLLLAFASQQNQVLTREQLLAEVWGDEGIMVGRSLDVFVSRLRKILALDPSLQIKNIHGVGYRLEV